jgi:hypothetical protein
MPFPTWVSFMALRCFSYSQLRPGAGLQSPSRANRINIGDAVATIFDILIDGTGSENDPVPSVDPADLKSVWTTQTDSPTLAAGEQFAINVDLYRRVCSPGADVRAVFIRESMMRVLTLMSESGD